MKEGFSEELLALFLPEGILDYFELVSYEKSSSGKTLYESELVLSLEEKDIIPAEYKDFQGSPTIFGSEHKILFICC